MRKKVLLISCGDIGLRLADRLPDDGYEFAALRRNTAVLPEQVSGIQWDLNQSQGLAEKIGGFDFVVITPVPNTPDEAGYRQAYEKNVAALVQALSSHSRKPELVILVSSSRVYHQADGEWVDESSPCEPTEFRGRRLLAGEAILRNSHLPHCIVRFSGIYGPGREHLLRQVRAGTWSPADGNYSNRIHSEDCAGVLAHIIETKAGGEPLENLYLASDCAPVLLGEVRQWLADEMGLARRAVPEASTVGGRRCNNRRLLDSGYRFIYPTFREGYKSLLRHP